MSQFAISDTNNAKLIVTSGSPETLVINHSTKNTVLIGNTNAVGSGTQLDATPLDPYASIVVDGQADLWCVAAVANAPSQVLTQTNAIAWTPKAIQPNIVDPNSPYAVLATTNVFELSVPPSAQGLMLNLPSPAAITVLSVQGVETGVVYALVDPATTDPQNIWWFPVLSDADSSVTVTVTGTLAQPMTAVWIMTQFASAPVADGLQTEVFIANTDIPIINQPGTLLSVTEANESMYANQVPVPFDLTLAALTSSVILPASVGTQYKIHDIRVDVVTAADIGYAQFQDTSGATFANVFQQANGSSPGINTFHGANLEVGLGLQLKNNTVNTQRYVGYVTYSK